ncbi:hypothetical protein C7E20_20300 [Sphingobium sp. AEW4]|nr:hypothetical protein C7E20_20300 [Sphingobium sp. AEW4]
MRISDKLKDCARSFKLHINGDLIDGVGTIPTLDLATGNVFAYGPTAHGAAEPGRGRRQSHLSQLGGERRRGQHDLLLGDRPRDWGRNRVIATLLTHGQGPHR